jgi:hypothetical protein
MAEKSEGSPVPAILGLALVALGIAAQTVVRTSSRPTIAASIPDDRGAFGSARARPWEDPLEVAYRDRDAAEREFADGFVRWQRMRALREAGPADPEAGTANAVDATFASGAVADSVERQRAALLEGRRRGSWWRMWMAPTSRHSTAPRSALSRSR